MSAAVEDRDLELAQEHYRCGRTRQAEPLCRLSLAARPGNPEALTLLGRVLLASGRARFAVATLEQAEARRPDDPEVAVALGQALYEAGDVKAALERFDRALAADPSDGAALMSRGLALLDLARPSEALDDLDRAARVDPDKPVRHFWLANAQLENGHDAAARASLEEAIRLDGAARTRHQFVGSHFALLGQVDRARRVFQWGAALRPDDRQLPHLIAALDGDRGPVRASDDYVTDHFDALADRFDEVLVERLKYRTPGVIVEAARRALGSAGEALDVLDAGCGTGLCGPLLRPLARRLVGIDLSPKMIERARDRESYDELHVGEITAAMAASPASYDLVVAADVLVYFGELDDFMTAAATAVRPGGVIAVSVERHGQDDGYTVQPSGRYAHGAGYLRDACARAGLEDVELQEAQIRLEDLDPVAGYICTAKRPPAPARAPAGDVLAFPFDLFGDAVLTGGTGELLERSARAGNPDALHLVGRLLLKSGRPRFALPVLRQAERQQPESAALALSVGRALYQTGDSAAALERFMAAARDEPASGSVRMNLGLALLDLGRTAEAVTELRRAADLEPDKPARHFWLANALLDAGDDDGARASFEAAVGLSPGMRDQHHVAGGRFAAAGLTERARRLYLWGAALRPSDPQLGHLLAALDGDGGPARASDDYLVDHFDEFAGRFDEVLVERLHYRAPELLAEAARRALGSAGEALDVLDAGCGTGLCGPLLRPLARRLVGIDISPGMIERARARDSYDELHLGEITAAMAASPESYDLVVAADVLIYFGDLDDLLSAAATAVRPGGVVAVSVERHSQDEGYMLQPSGRYAHGAGYLRAACERAGLEDVELQEAQIRLEDLDPVAGYICTARRPSVEDRDGR